jgi:hypothetical protein
VVLWALRLSAPHLENHILAVGFGIAGLAILIAEARGVELWPPRRRLSQASPPKITVAGVAALIFACAWAAFTFRWAGHLEAAFFNLVFAAFGVRLILGRFLSGRGVQERLFAGWGLVAFLSLLALTAIAVALSPSRLLSAGTSLKAIPLEIATLAGGLRERGAVAFTFALLGFLPHWLRDAVGRYIWWSIPLCWGAAFLLLAVAGF